MMCYIVIHTVNVFILKKKQVIILIQKKKIPWFLVKKRIIALRSQYSQFIDDDDSWQVIYSSGPLRSR